MGSGREQYAFCIENNGSIVSIVFQNQYGVLVRVLPSLLWTVCKFFRMMTTKDLV